MCGGGAWEKYMDNRKGAVTQEREGWTPKTTFARTQEKGMSRSWVRELSSH